MSDVVPRLRQVVIDSTDARATAEFWRQLLGLDYLPGHEPPAPGSDDPAGRDWLNLAGPDGVRVIAVQQVEDLPHSTWPTSHVPQQLHLDLAVRNRAELDTAHQRVLALGGTLRLDRADDVAETLRVRRPGRPPVLRLRRRLNAGRIHGGRAHVRTRRTSRAW